MPAFTNVLYTLALILFVSSSTTDLAPPMHYEALGYLGCLSVAFVVLMNDISKKLRV